MYRVLVYFDSYELSDEGTFEDFYEAQDALEKAKNQYLKGVDEEDLENEEEIFYFNSRIEEI